MIHGYPYKQQPLFMGHTGLDSAQLNSRLEIVKDYQHDECLCIIPTNQPLVKTFFGWLIQKTRLSLIDIVSITRIPPHIFNCVVPHISFWYKHYRGIFRIPK